MYSLGAMLVSIVLAAPSPPSPPALFVPPQCIEKITVLDWRTCKNDPTAVGREMICERAKLRVKFSCVSVKPSGPFTEPKKVERPPAKLESGDPQ